MKKIILIATLIAFTFNVFAQNNENKKSESNISEVTLSTKLDCDACSQKVKKQLSFVSGIKKISPDHVKDIIVIKYRNDKTNPEEMIESLGEIGYKARIKEGPKVIEKKGSKGKSETSCAGQKSKSAGCCSTKANTEVEQKKSGCCSTKKEVSNEKKSSCSDKPKSGCGSKANANETPATTKVSEQVKTGGCAAKRASGQGGCCKSK